MIKEHYNTIKGGAILQSDEAYFISKKGKTKAPHIKMEFSLARKQPIEFPMISRIGKGFAVLDSTTCAGFIIIPFKKDYKGIINQYREAREWSKSATVADMLLCEYLSEEVACGKTYYSFQGFRAYYEPENSLSRGYAWQKVLIRALRSFKGLTRKISVKMPGDEKPYNHYNLKMRDVGIIRKDRDRLDMEKSMSEYPPDPKKGIKEYLDYHYPSYEALRLCLKALVSRGINKSECPYQRFPYIMADSTNSYWNARAGVGTSEECTNSFSIEKLNTCHDDTREEKELRAQYVALEWKKRIDTLTESPYSMDKLLEVFYYV